MMTQDKNLIQRALTAHRKRTGEAEDEPKAELSTIEYADGLVYVALRNDRGIVSIYKHVISNDKLKRILKRWPDRLLAEAAVPVLTRKRIRPINAWWLAKRATA